MAHRYGKLPSEIIALSVEDFSLNRIVLEMGAKYEKSIVKGKPLILSSGDDDVMALPRKLDAMLARVSGARRRPGRK